MSTTRECFVSKADRRRAVRRSVQAYVAIIATSVFVPQSFANTMAVWTVPISDTWTSTSNWSIAPLYPDNNNPPGTTYDAILNATGSAYTVTLSNNIALDNLTVGSSNTILRQTAGMLSLTGNLTVQSGTLQLGGTIVGGTLSATGGKVVAYNNLLPVFSGITTGAGVITISGSSTFASANGLTVPGNSTLTLGAFLSGTGNLRFDGSQTLGGTGVIILDGDNGNSANLFANNGLLTIAPGITIRGGASPAFLSNTSTGTITNYGLISAGAASTLTISGAFSNQGTVEARNGGTLTFNSPASLANLQGSTLTGGSWQVFTGSNILLPSVTITTINADLTLSGTGGIAALNGLATNNGTLRLLANHNQVTPSNFTNNSFIQMGGGTLTVHNILTNNSGGSITGYGQLSAQLTNYGLIQAAGGSLSLTTSSSASLQSNTGASLVLSGGTGDSSSDSLVLQSGGSLVLGTRSIAINVSYVNANIGSGNTFNKHADVSPAVPTSSTGRIITSGNNFQTLTGNVTNGGNANPTIDIGTVHVGDTFSPAQVNNRGNRGAAVLYGIQTDVNGANVSSSRLIGQNIGPVPLGGSAPLVLTAMGAGSVTGMTLHIANNFDNILEQTATLTGTILNYAAPSFQKATGGGSFSLTDSTHATLDFGVLSLGATTSTVLSLLNIASAPADSLAGSWSLTAPDFSFSNFSDFTGLLPGGTLTGLAINFAATSSGFFTQTATLHPLSQDDIPFSGTLSDFTLTLKVAVNPLPAIWNGTTGNWSNAANWSTSPVAPSNGSPANALYVVSIPTGTVALDINAKIQSLSFGTGSTFTGTLNLNTHKLIVQATSASDKIAQLASLIAAINAGNNQGTWTGKGLTSSTAAQDPTRYAVGLFDNGILNLPSFGGQPVDSNSLLVSIAHLGDANLSGIVDIQDQSIVTNHWQSAQSTWSSGDLNLDGIVDLQDLTLVTNNWQQQSGPSSQLPFTNSQLPSIPTPEPSSLLLLLPTLFFRKRPKHLTP